MIEFFKEDDRKERSISESINRALEYSDYLLKNGERIALNILEIFEKEKTPEIVAYNIIKKILEAMEEKNKALKLSSDLAKSICNNLSETGKEEFLNKIISLAQKEALGEEKADSIICSNKKIREKCKEVKCYECGNVCYVGENDKELLKDNPKHICINCALDNPKYSKELNESSRKMLERLRDGERKKEED